MQLCNGEEGAASWDRGGTRLNGARRNATLNGSGSVALRSFQKEILIVFLLGSGLCLLCCCFPQCCWPSGIHLHPLGAGEHLFTEIVIRKNYQINLQRLSIYLETGKKSQSAQLNCRLAMFFWVCSNNCVKQSKSRDSEHRCNWWHCFILKGFNLHYNLPLS